MIAIHAQRINGEIDAIPSKSYAHRALICAALADQPSIIRLGRSSVDIDTTAAALNQIGAMIRREAAGFRVEPIHIVPPFPAIDCAESGSTLRFLLPVAAGVADEVQFTGRGRLPLRPLSPLPEEMEKKGCSFSAYTLPLTIRGRLSGGTFQLPGDVSSQFVSGLLLAAPKLGDTEIEITTHLESADYVKITIDVMEAFGVPVEETEAGYRVATGSAYRGRNYAVEGDWSNAAFFLVGGALSEGIRMHGLEPASAQGDRGIVDVLVQYGANVEVSDVISVRPKERRPIRVDLRKMPDSLPILAVLAAGAVGDSVFTGGKRLRLKESDRLQTTAALLQNLGGQVTQTEDGLIVHGTGSLRGGTTSSFGDHRLAMASAIASVLCTKPVVIEQEEAVNKSYPGFFADFQAIGGEHV